MTAIVTYEPASFEDLDDLVELRIAAMRESLERLGRFDPARARERFASSFEPEFTRHIVVEGRRVGCVVVKPHTEGLLLDHLYLRLSEQGQGIGGCVLGDVIVDAEARQLVLHVSALRDSAANAFYLRYGFRKVSEAEWDVYYRREPASF